MKRWGLVAAVLVCSTVTAFPSRAVEAQTIDGCGKALPTAAFADWVHEIPSSAIPGVAFAPSPDATATFTGLATGAVAGLGSAAVTSGVAASTATVIGATAGAIAVMDITCRAGDWTDFDDVVAGAAAGVVDWFSGDSASVTPAASVASQILGTPKTCTETGAPASSMFASWGSATCRKLTYPDLNTLCGTTDCHWFSNALGDVTAGAVTLPAAERKPNFNADGLGSTIVFGMNVSCQGYGGLLRFFSAVTNSCSPGYTPTRSWDSDTQNLVYTTSGTNCHTSGYNVGGSCGVWPGITYGVKNTTSDTWAGFVIPWPELGDHGWQRFIRTYIRCHNRVTNANTSHYVDTPTFYDNEPDQRAQIPICGVDNYPTGVELYRLPAGTNPNCLGGSTACDRFLIQRSTAPSTWSTTGTAPDYAFCLTIGEDCGVPGSVSSTCIWGGFDVSTSEACGATTGATATPSVVRSRVYTDALVTEPSLVEPGTDTLGTTVEPTVEDPDPGGGTTVIVDVPIDPGGGLGAGLDDDGEAECWPDGWGWFNPGQWVLRPIKCALVWAFVPDPGTFETFVADARLLLEDEIPFSLLFGLVDVLDAATTSLSAPDGTSCVTLDGLIPEAGSVEACPASITVGSTQRTLLTVLIVGPMFVALCGHALTMVRGR